MSLSDPDAPVKLVNVYYSRIPHCRYIFKDGTGAIFASGRYTTDDPIQIAELDNEIVKKHPTFYVYENAKTVDVRMLDPMEVMREQIISEYLAKMAAKAGNPNRDMGNTQRTNLNPASSRMVAAVSAGGDGASTFPMLKIPPTVSDGVGLLPVPESDGSKLQSEDADMQAGLAALSVFDTAAA
jgi:hypothetical protein